MAQAEWLQQITNKMTTHDRARYLAEAARHFPWLRPVVAADLIELVRLELGDADILDDFAGYGSIRARALPPDRLLLVVSGATPHAALQALIRGLLLGGPIRCKVPAGGLPEVGQFLERLPADLRGRVECREEMPELWLEEADVVVAFGSDETLTALRKHLRADQRFLGHGHRVSFGIVAVDQEYASVAEAARDASLFDQRGCLSPHVFYVAESGGFVARDYAGRLAGAMRDFQGQEPRQPLDLSGHAAIRERRLETAFAAANEGPVALWCSPDDTSWTVIFDAAPGFPDTPLNRVIYVKPWPADWRVEMAPVRPWISTIGCWPLDEATAALAMELGASRVCRIGRMQAPSLFWHQDGEPQLAGLVRWIDWERAEDL